MSDMKSHDSQLPSYADVRSNSTSQTSSAAFSTQHTFSLNNTKGKPWLSLHISSRAPTDKTLPVFRDGDEIRGEVKVQLEDKKPESCKGILVGVSEALSF